VSDKCADLLSKVPIEEQRRHGVAIYHDLTDWLSDPATTNIEKRYVDLGVRRAHQGVAFSNVFWAVCIAHNYLWEYIQQECLLDEPVEFWGGVQLLHSLTQFFDRALYYALLGYEKVQSKELTASPAA
jgi:hypothetical protein